MTRLPGWEERLARFIEARLRMPFSWGRHDCCLFAADAILAITGRDPAPDLRGYNTGLQAARKAWRFARGGVVAVAEKIAEREAMLETPPLFARRGDIAFLPGPRDGMLGVVVGSAIAVPAADMLLFVELTSATKAWEV